MYARQHKFAVLGPAVPAFTEAIGNRMTLNIKRPLLTLMWTSIGLAVIAGGLYLGNELRKQRLANRTPYESYSHAGDDGGFNGAEYGVGI
ncbi:MAG TPA: hypothetical protein VFQ00_10605 [Terriglobales bacterium]|nr:hypothetical protein [Terriglobales bacterium]